MTAAVSLLFALVVAPDRVPLADEWGYRPADGSTVAVNPPSLSWVLEKDAASYSVQWADNAGFARPTTLRDLPWSVYTHYTALKPGRYWWRYRILGKDGSQSAWSRARTFTVPAEATVFPQPTLAQLRHVIPKQHPRLFVRSEDLERLKKCPGIPPQWHVEASSTEPAAQAFTLTVLRVYRRGRMPASQVRVERGPSSLGIRVVGSEQKEVAVTFQTTRGKDFALIRRDGRQWKVSAFIERD